LVEGNVAKRTPRKPKAAPAKNIESNSLQGEQAMLENKPSTAVTTGADENGKSAENVSIPPKVETDLAPLPPDPLKPVTTPVLLTPEDEKLLQPGWPPPLYTPLNSSLAEKYYLKQRWQSQWLWYDKKAGENKWKHQSLQVLIGVGSVAVPVLLTAQEPWRNLAALVSLIVAAAASIENVKKYGDNWRSYRRAAENLSREKSLFDVNAGPYRTSKRPFARLVERCEEVIAQQNGQFYQRDEQTQTQTTTQSGQPGTQTYQQTETETDTSTG
jgi:hypothetical protein